MDIFTNQGWIEIEQDSDVDELECCDCGADAARITDAGRNSEYEAILWAHCLDCANQTAGENHDARESLNYW